MSVIGLITFQANKPGVEHTGVSSLPPGEEGRVVVVAHRAPDYVHLGGISYERGTPVASRPLEGGGGRSYETPTPIGSP